MVGLGHFFPEVLGLSSIRMLPIHELRIYLSCLPFVPFPVSPHLVNPLCHHVNLLNLYLEGALQDIYKDTVPCKFRIDVNVLTSQRLLETTIKSHYFVP